MSALSPAPDATSAPDGSHAVVPIPRRYWWLKRLLVGAVLYIALLAGLRWWAIARADASLQAHLAARRATGERVRWEDFAAPPLAGPNAAADFQAAGDLLLPPNSPLRLGVVPACPNCPQHSVSQYAWSTWLVRRYPECAAALLADQGAALERIAQGLATPETQWPPINRAQLLVMRDGPWCQAESAALLMLMTSLRYRSGDDRAAIDGCHDALSVAERATAPPATLEACQVADAGVRLVAAVIADLANELRVTAGSPSTAAPDAAARAAVEALIARLLDDRDQDAALRTALQFERMTMVEVIRMLREDGRNAVLATPAPRGTALDGIEDFLREPEYLRQSTALIEIVSGMIDARAAGDWETMYWRATTIDPNYRSSTPIVQATNRWPWDLIGTVHSARSATAARRLAATFLALRLYELDYDALPPSLDALVPDYLPSAPRNVFDNRQTLRLCPCGEDAVVVYSVDRREPLDCARLAIEWQQREGLAWEYIRAVAADSSERER